ncbi:hypothetical protein [Streptomyces albipurpureus]|uniref:Uncharacterized protein n=1 Tax=Streptomyces albipurpureus TaxID=2897419 RepID=A0ABT0UWA3_9ACTN|nr:hypothetical protein [Streptomyces sp. CWNU-1]MCM2392511.1 hypothetical protein [Streptomyces sp. CWNU-1]
MPSEGKPQPIDTAVITGPGDVPTTDLRLLADRRERHTTGITSKGVNGDRARDVIAALALGAAIRRVLDDQEQNLIREGLRHGATWEQLAGALGVVDPAEARRAFTSWSQQLPENEATEALRIAGDGPNQ